MVLSGSEFVRETSSVQRRARVIRASRILLSAVARMLIMADMIDVQLMLKKIEQIKANLSKIVSAESKQELSELYGLLQPNLKELDELTRRRMIDLRDPSEQDDLQAARAWLKISTNIMCSASTVSTVRFWSSVFWSYIELFLTIIFHLFFNIIFLGLCSAS